MKRIVLWLLSTISAVVLLFGYHTSTAGTMATTQQPVGASLATTSTTSTSGGTGGAGGTGSGTGSGSGTNTQTGSTVKGAVAQTRWGPVQVQITTDGSGTITDVEVVQYPSGNNTDEQINSYALPILVQSTLDAQGAKIDMVSGATVTSEGYLQSLQSALDQA